VCSQQQKGLNFMRHVTVFGAYPVKAICEPHVARTHNLTNTTNHKRYCKINQELHLGTFKYLLLTFMPPQTIFVTPCLLMNSAVSSPDSNSPTSSAVSSIDHVSFANLQLETPKKRVRGKTAEITKPAVSFSTPTPNRMYFLLIR
jgi:hypothetical protein